MTHNDTTPTVTIANRVARTTGRPYVLVETVRVERLAIPNQYGYGHHYEHAARTRARALRLARETYGAGATLTGAATVSHGLDERGYSCRFSTYVVTLPTGATLAPCAS